MTIKRAFISAVLLSLSAFFVRSVPGALANGTPDNFVPSAIQVQTAGIETPLFFNFPVIAGFLGFLLILSWLLLYRNKLSLPLVKYRPKKHANAGQVVLPLSPLAALPEAEETAKA